MGEDLKALPLVLLSAVAVVGLVVVGVLVGVGVYLWVS